MNLTLLNFGKIKLNVHANHRRYNATDEEWHLGFHTRVGEWCFLNFAGVGWDLDHPVRPWPWVTYKPSPGGRTCLCVSWCSLFYTVCITRK